MTIEAPAQTDVWMDGCEDRQKEMGGRVIGKMVLNEVFPLISIQHRNVVIDGSVAAERGAAAQRW